LNGHVDAAGLARGPVLVDAHVHVHSCFDATRLLESAVRNFEMGARGVALDTQAFTGVLLLTGGQGEGAFSRLALGAAAGGWQRLDTDDPYAMVLRGRDGRTLIVLEGHQIVTAERLEVLALCCGPSLPDGGGLEETILAVRRAGGIAVLPWGFGKWMFRRGALVAKLLRRSERRVFLGDNGGRPALSWTPRLLRAGQALGLPVLPGSDPLPFPGQEQRVGSVGVVCEASLSLEEPAASVREWLGALREQPVRFGRGVGLVAFVRDQGRMQFRKFGRRR